jgi:hypothetical protein
MHFTISGKGMFLSFLVGVVVLVVYVVLFRNQ